MISAEGNVCKSWNWGASRTTGMCFLGQVCGVIWIPTESTGPKLKDFGFSGLTKLSSVSVCYCTIINFRIIRHYCNDKYFSNNWFVHMNANDSVQSNKMQCKNIKKIGDFDKCVQI